MYYFKTRCHGVERDNHIECGNFSFQMKF